MASVAALALWDHLVQGGLLDTADLVTADAA